MAHITPEVPTTPAVVAAPAESCTSVHHICSPPVVPQWYPGLIVNEVVKNVVLFRTLVLRPSRFYSDMVKQCLTIPTVTIRLFVKFKSRLSQALPLNGGTSRIYYT